MQTNLFRNATTYTAELPCAEDMRKHLAERPFKQVGENFLSSLGFVENLATGELVTEFPGGYSFTARFDEKSIPSGSLAAAYDAAFDKFREDNNLDADEGIDKEVRGELKEAVYVEMVKRAILKAPVYVNCFFHTESKYLYITTTSKALTSSVMSAVIQCVGSVKTSTIWVADIKGGLTARLKKYLGQGEYDLPPQLDAFGVFKIGDALVLKKESDRVSFNVGNLDIAKHGMIEALGAEMLCESMVLEHNGVEFKLTHDFKMRSVKFLEELDEQEEEERYGDGADGAHIWRLDAGVQTALVVSTTCALCDMFEYKAPVDGAPLVSSQVVVRSSENEEFTDENYDEAVILVRTKNAASISMLQRKFKIGYNRAARLIGRLEDEGVVSAMNSNGSRTVLF